jgi:hypothetical protein
MCESSTPSLLFYVLADLFEFQKELKSKDKKRNKNESAI